MSVSVSILLKKNKVNRNGEYPIYIRVTKDRVSRFITTGICVEESLWDEKQKKVKKGYPNSVRVNHLISQKTLEVQAKALEWETDKKTIKNKKIQKEIYNINGDSFTEYFDQYLKYLQANNFFGTLDKAKATYSKLHKFCKSDKILFKEIDVDFLKKFEKYLRDQLGNRMNTIHANLKMMRKLFNDAVREELIPYNLNPFPRYPLRTEKSDKIYLTESEIEKIENLDLTQHRRLNDHRNLFLFACTAAGVRISDLFKLKWKNFNGTHILFTQQKTREQNGIKLPLKALAILEGYKSQTGEFSENYIFPFLTNQTEALDIFDSVSSMTAYANKNLKEIARMAGIEKHITTHTARHTFATRALRKGIRIENVSKLLGHSSIKTTQVYAKIVNEELDKSMEVFNE